MKTPSKNQHFDQPKWKKESVKMCAEKQGGHPFANHQVSKRTIQTGIGLARSSNNHQRMGDNLKIKEEMKEECPYCACLEEQAIQTSIKLDPELVSATVNHMASTCNGHLPDFDDIKIKKEVRDECAEVGQKSIKSESELNVDIDLVTVKVEQPTIEWEELADDIGEIDFTLKSEHRSESDNEKRETSGMLPKKSFSATDVLRKRKPIVRQGTSNKKFVDTTDKPVYICHECGKRIKQSKCKLRWHIKTGCKPYSCGECGFRSNQTWSLNRHMRTHTGEKPYACGVCKYRTNDPSNIRRHIKTHTGAKPFACKMCDYRTAEQPKLRRHLMKRSHKGLCT